MRSNHSVVPKENKTHGDADFPLALYRMEVEPDETVVDCHWHNEGEFLCITHGETLFQIGDAFFPLKAGEAVFVHGGDIHAGHAAGTGGCGFFALVFDMNWLRSGPHDRLLNQHVTPLIEGSRSLPRLYDPTTDWGANVLSHLAQIRDAYQTRSVGHELVVKSSMYLILPEIAANGLWTNRESAADSWQLMRLKDVLAFIDSHYSGKIQLKDLAEIAHMSESQFCRFFKRIVRKTPVEYINGYRVRKAAELLREGSNRKLIEVAGDAGFDNLSYFIKRFREEMNCTPAEYRDKRN